MKLYLLISRLFDPIAVLTVITVIAIRLSSLTPYEQFRFFLFLIFSIVGVPVILLLVAIRYRFVSNWDVTDRRQRPKLLIGLIAIESANLLLIWNWGDAFLFSLFLVYLAWIIGFLAVTLFYKISGHLGGLTFAVLLYLNWFGSSYWPLLLTIPLLAWARVTGRFHTVGQVLTGMIYSLVVILAFRRILLPG
jgi:hypothetical protein